MKVRQLTGAILLAFCLAGPAFAANSAHSLPGPSATPTQELDRIVAYVNNGIITQSEFNQAYKVAREQQEHARAVGLPEVPASQLRTLVMDQLIAQHLQLQMAKQQGLKISDKQLNAAIAQIAKKHKVSVKRLYQTVKQQGMSRAAYRDQIRTQITIMTLQRAIVGNQANSTPAEIKAYKAAHGSMLYKVGDILIPLPSNPSKNALNKAMKKADTIKKALRRSKNYEKTAQTYAPNNHNVLDWVSSSQMPDLFADALESTRVNTPAGPLRAPNGLHILYLLGKKSSRAALTDQQVRMLLFRQKSEKIIVPWLQKLKDTSDIRIVKSS